MKKRAVLSLVLAAMLVLSGCGSSSSSSTSADTDTDEEATEEEAEEEAADTEEEAAEEETEEEEDHGATADENGSYYQETTEGSVLNIAIGDSITSWAPWSSGSGFGNSMIYQTLMNDDMEPMLAYAYEEIEENVYAFYLWDNITDSNGNALTASDVVFSIEEGVASGNIHGASVIESVEAIDDYTVYVTFTHAPYIGDLETAAQINIVTQASYEASEDGMVTTPIGTGPYVLENWVADSITTFVARDDYWAEPDQILSPEMECSIETVNYQIISEAAQQTIALETGSVDYAGELTNEDLSFFQEGGEYADDYTVDIIPAGLTQYVLLNCSDDSVCSNVALREAIYYAIDAESIVQSVANGMGILTHDGSNSTLQDYNPEWDEEDNYYNYDLENAAEKLAEAGYSSGELTLTLFCESGDTATNIGTIVQAFLMQIGIDVSIEAYEPSMLENFVSDSSAWDILICCFGSQDYVVNNWAHIMDPANWSWGLTYNFIDDDYLVDLLYTCKSLDGHTEENLDLFHEYCIENAYMMGLYNGYTCGVISNKYTAVYNSQGSLLAQATIIN